MTDNEQVMPYKEHIPSNDKKRYTWPTYTTEADLTEALNFGKIVE